LAKPALPERPVAPISESLQPAGSVEGGGAAVTVRDREVLLVRDPEVPVIVMDTVPVVAAPEALRVNVLVVLVLLMVAGLNEAVTPVGRVEFDNVTLPVNPFCGLRVMVLEPAVPCTSERLLGEPESEKLGVAAALTVKERAVVLVREPEVPLMVTVTVPVVAVLLALRVNVLVLLLPVLGVLTGLKEAVTPLGRAEFDKVTLPVNPFCGVMVMVLLPLEPWVMLKLDGDAKRAKLGEEPGQLFTRLAALTVPMPVAKSQPVALL